MTRIIRRGEERAPLPRQPRPGSTRIVRRAQQAVALEAEQLLVAARDRADTLSARALEEAHAELAELRAHALAEVAALRVAAEADRWQLLADARAELTELALGIAAKLLGEELRLHPDSVTRIVAQCVRGAARARRIVVRVNPSDLPQVEAALPELRGLSEAEVVLTESDGTIPAGGCILETDGAQLDGRLESQLAALRRGLQGEVPR
ncbi:MAG: hypothetical protein IT371_04885 [Deltaproteobacteria bacterium]|nr:hypothetical protein [Deltaproteobacteria bacterium]